jgi:hypothetical protein
MDGLQQVPRENVSSRLPWLHLLAVIVGILVALLVSGGRSSGALRQENSRQFSQRQSSSLLPVSLSDRDLDRRQPQEQAKILLERAIGRAAGAPAQTEAEIEVRLDRRRGKPHWDAELGELTTAALNSEDRNVRTSAIEVQLAAYGLAESGMLSREQRLTAVPHLIDSGDPALDSQTHAWAFEALADITKQHLPNDSVAWHDWYQKSVASDQ